MKIGVRQVNGKCGWFIHFISCLVAVCFVTEFSFLLFSAVILASINGKRKCQVRTWNKECFKKIARINLKNQGDQVGNNKSKQKTGAMVSRRETILVFHWVILENSVRNGFHQLSNSQLTFQTFRGTVN